MIATIPSASTILASSSDWSSPIFNEFLPIVYITVGVFAGVVLLTVVIAIFIGAFEKMSDHASTGFSRRDVDTARRIQLNKRYMDLTEEDN